MDDNRLYTNEEDMYPTVEDLDKIAEWPANDFEGLRLFVFKLWHWPEFATVEGGMWRLATGGWSGNEDIINALRDNWRFWIMCWQSSHRGGLYWFKVPKTPDKTSENPPE